MEDRCRIKGGPGRDEGDIITYCLKLWCKSASKNYTSYGKLAEMIIVSDVRIAGFCKLLPDPKQANKNLKMTALELTQYQSL